MSQPYKQVRNELRDIEAIADGYRQKIGKDTWLAYGLQKDAIQNSWDAREYKRGQGWECGFTLMKINKTTVLRIEDSGTLGLGGDKFYSEEELINLLHNGKGQQDLAYFLNSNWSSKDIDKGGNRGRGKTLFLAASKQKRVTFDSLRKSDGAYISGELYVDIDNQIKFQVFYDKEGKDWFKWLVHESINPLDHYGTRIFISDPEPLIIQALSDEEMLSFISNTRWETIKKHAAKIYVDNGNGKKYANIPNWYEETGFSNNIFQEIPAELIKTGTAYKTKRLVLRYDETLNLPEDIKGIAIQRSGMTIERISAEELVHEEGISGIYGWLEMERDPLERDLKQQCEGPEHLDINWTVKPAKYLRDYLRIKIREFAKKFKISGTEQSKINDVQKSAQSEALKTLSPIFKQLGLSGKKSGSGHHREFNRDKNEPIRLSIPDLNFPNSTRRVNYGEEITGSYVIPINETDNDIYVLVKTYIAPSDGSEPEILQEKEFNLEPGAGQHIGAPFIKIDKKFRPGKYTIKAKMICLEDTEILLKGEKVEKGFCIYDRINQTFYVEEDPPESGPINFLPKPKNDKSFIFEWEPDYGGYLIYYNTLHPRIKLLGDVSELTEYLVELGIFIALQIKLEESLSENITDDADFASLIKSKNIGAVMKLFISKYSQYQWDIHK